MTEDEAIAGKKLERLTFECRLPGKKCQCRCDCGRLHVLLMSEFGHTKSCGCLRSEKARERAILRNFKHGLRRNSEYNIWSCMKQRCENGNDKDWPRYGGRGIFVCDRWLVFELFFEDMGLRPSKDHQIERRDNDGGYCPENCYWATRSQQARNRRSSRIIEFGGQSLTLVEWSAKTGLLMTTISERLKRGWSVEKTLTKVVGKYRNQLEYSL